MKIKLYQALNFLDGYLDLKDKEMNIKTAYKLNKCFLKCEEEQKFYQEKITNLINIYAEKDENGQPKTTEDKTSILIEKNKQVECNQKISELNNLEIEIPDNYLISIDELNFDISLATITKIEAFLKE